MRLLLVRHAHAGSRSSWVGDDHLRPLSPKGDRQALALADRLADEPVDRIRSSPAARCVQTVEPLADRLGLTVEVHVDLFEGSDHRKALVLLEEIGDGVEVWSTHGDLIPDLLVALQRHGLELEGAFQWPKASVWVLDGPDRLPTRATYIGPGS